MILLRQYATATEDYFTLLSFFNIQHPLLNSVNPVHKLLILFSYLKNIFTL